MERLGKGGFISHLCHLQLVTSNDHPSLTLFPQL